eukprot:g7317.t1
MCSGMSVYGMKVASPPPIRRRSNVKQIKLRKRTSTAFLPSNFVPPLLKQFHRDRMVRVHATERNEESDLIAPEDYVEAQIDSIYEKDRCGILSFRLKDPRDSILNMYIGEFEYKQILQSINEHETSRPMSYDFMRNSLRSLGFRVIQIRVTELVGHTYHARVFYKSKSSKDVISVDARPSDAVNLAIRFSAPLFVHREIAQRMATLTQSGVRRTHGDVVKLCHDEIKLHQDPTVMLKLQMQMAIVQERYDEAAELRDEIDRVLASDRVLGMVVALESALSGGRFDEALQLRDELRKFRRSRGGSEKHKSH